jgi:hypothetical protein
VLCESKARDFFIQIFGLGRSAWEKDNIIQCLGLEVGLVMKPPSDVIRGMYELVRLHSLPRMTYENVISLVFIYSFGRSQTRISVYLIALLRLLIIVYTTCQGLSRRKHGSVTVHFVHYEPLTLYFLDILFPHANLLCVDLRTLSAPNEVLPGSAKEKDCYHRCRLDGHLVSSALCQPWL